MRSEAPVLMPIFRSRHQAELLTWLLLHPDREYTATELAARLGVPLTTLHREVQRLVAADLLQARTVGRARLLKANPNHRATPPLTHLLEVTFGPRTVVEDEFASVAGVEEVMIFGSWAARYYGAPGRVPADLDVLVIGGPDRGDVYDAADRVQERLGVAVNPVIRSRRQWDAAADALVQEVKASPTLVVISRDEDAA
jgi:predicted nucleotidyltransferase